jgi:hypothetical protein
MFQLRDGQGARAAPAMRVYFCNRGLNMSNNPGGDHNQRKSSSNYDPQRQSESDSKGGQDQGSASQNTGDGRQEQQGGSVDKGDSGSTATPTDR